MSSEVSEKRWRAALRRGVALAKQAHARAKVLRAELRKLKDDPETQEYLERLIAKAEATAETPEDKLAMRIIRHRAKPSSRDPGKHNPIRAARVNKYHMRLLREGKWKIRRPRKALVAENYNVVDRETDRVVGHVSATWVVDAQRKAELKFGKGVLVWAGKKEPLGEKRWSKKTVWNDPDRMRDPSRPRRLPGPKPTVTFAIFHPTTNEKKVYKGVKNKYKAHRQAMAWARHYKKNVRLTLLSSNAFGARPFKVTAKGKWVTKQTVKNPKAKRHTKYVSNGRGGWKLAKRDVKRKPKNKAAKRKKG